MESVSLNKLSRGRAAGAASTARAAGLRKGRRAVLLVAVMAMFLLTSLLLTGCGGSASSGGSGSSSAGGSFTDGSSSGGSSVSSSKPEGTKIGSGKETLTILSGSENKELEPVIEDFADKENVAVTMYYQGSLDIMRALENKDFAYDAVWPASSLWLNTGDTLHRVKHTESISLNPVVFGIKKSLAEELGFVGKEVSVSDILDAILAGKLKFCMTSATQSNSGASAYLGFLHALAGSPDVITEKDLENTDLQKKVTELLAGVDRSSGSSDWLKDMFLGGDFDAMVNYECLMISANQELEKDGREPLYVVYPYDGLSIADSPLGYVDQGDKDKEALFQKFQDYLLSDEAQEKIQETGRRTAFLDITEENRKNVFREDWGIQPDRVLSAIKTPDADTLQKALSMYQSELRKPSLTVYCVDYSGSMYGEGYDQLIAAMEQLLIQKNAEANYLQASPDDVTIIIPFDDRVRDVWTAAGNGSDLEDLYLKLKDSEPDGGTDMYAAITEGLKRLKKYDLSAYTPAIIVMTDGMSWDDYQNFAESYKEGGYAVPIFSITYGDADTEQLDQLAELSNARVFDGRDDLTGAFRKVKGYN